MSRGRKATGLQAVRAPVDLETAELPRVAALEPPVAISAFVFHGRYFAVAGQGESHV